MRRCSSEATARHEDVDALAGLLTSLRVVDRVSEIELDRLSREETGVCSRTGWLIAGWKPRR